MNKIFSSRAGGSAIAICMGIAILPGTAHAGFLEQLFGVAPQEAPQVAPAPSYGHDAPRVEYYAPIHHRAKRKVVVDNKPKLQKPTDLMHDATLQTGDAVMLKGGIQVYTGDDRDSRHTKADFAALDEVSGVSKQERQALVAMDTTRNDPLRGTLKPDTIASGRSAAVANPIVAGSEIVDARGAKVRYVGP